jgi:hypothetical protein
VVHWLSFDRSVYVPHVEAERVYMLRRPILRVDIHRPHRIEGVDLKKAPERIGGPSGLFE